jgi:hypothetical protein
MEKSEIIVKVGAEGGDITIYGIRTKQGWLFSREVIDQSLMLLDEGATIQHKSEVANSWPGALELLDQYPWHKLRPREVHPEFQDIILDAVLERFKNERNPRQLSRWKESCGKP